MIVNTDTGEILNATQQRRIYRPARVQYRRYKRSYGLHIDVKLFLAALLLVGALIAVK